MLRKICCTLLLFFALGHHAWANTPVSGNDPEQLLGFAQHLFEAGEYYRAITEYQRFIYLYPKNPQAPLARFQIGECYFAGEEWDDAVNTWLANLDKPMPAALRHQTLYQLAAAYYKLEKYSLCRNYLEQLQKEPPSPELLLAGQKMLAASYLEQERWLEAAEAIQQMQMPGAKQLSEDVTRAKDLPLKSPGLAGGLSAVLPGAGQLYAERPQDAMVSFLLNGLFIWGAVEAFQHDKKVTGAILLFFETGWYFGNIYSATSSVHKYNRQLKEDFQKQTQERLQFKLGTPVAGPLGLSLSYKF